ncbi:acetoacetate decarboxylase [Streptomyces iconiensis]|uniref:Acetoacetate decarboxylase n=1 Tax=Streptomyces iconiensis TaxID=1384038 RepID=A0ABT6ZS15_9ACTN|nr:acetoacetate decarboxylase [Streptomyces iconiensis]MDJ1131845.1 acetoacetate decarboxylase [Streptomyces iconiensis]
MRIEDVLRRPTTPLTATPYPLRVPRFIDREYFNVVYRTDPDALRAAVPEPLLTGEPLVRFEVMRMGDVDGYGSYTECGQVLHASYEGEEGEYLHAMYLDNVGAILAGREWDAYPKSIGSPRLFAEASALIGTLDYGSQRVATATMPYKHEPMDPARAERLLTAPTFALNVVPGYDKGLRACDLVRTQITDLTVKQAWQGPARLQLFEHVMAPLADLPVLEVIEASHILTDLTLAPFTPVYDYLA